MCGGIWVEGIVGVHVYWPMMRYADVILMLAILHERRSELAFEHHRWFDLLRFFNINDLVPYMHAKNQANFGLASLANFSAEDEYFPKPYTEYILNPAKMYQNPGY